MLCVHCNRNRQGRPRGLCWACFYRPGVRESYAHLLLFTPGLAFNNITPPPPVAATTARPGTPEKVAVLEHRAAQGQYLWHPNDATY